MPTLPELVTMLDELQLQQREIVSRMELIEHAIRRDALDTRHLIDPPRPGTPAPLIVGDRLLIFSVDAPVAVHRLPDIVRTEGIA